MKLLTMKNINNSHHATEAKPLNQEPGHSSHPNFFNEDGWLYHQEQSGGITKLCSELEVIALTRDGHNQNWGRLVRLVDPDSQSKELALPMSMINAANSQCIPLLTNHGLVLANQKRQTKDYILEFISSSTVDKRMLCVPRPGWHGNVYVLPNKVFGQQDQSKERPVLQNMKANKSLIAQKGTLKDWQDSIGHYLPGNSRLMFASSVAFAAPLLSPLCESESGGFHFYGGSSIGKTTALLVAGSVWGGGGTNGFLQSWRTTDNALEYAAQAHCDALLCLDELGQVDSRKAGEIAYMLANGEGKSRSKKDGGLQEQIEWRLLFLSTGELRLTDKIAESGQITRAGQEARFVSIKADAGKNQGIFETTHGDKSPAELALHLKQASGLHYGAPALAYLEKLVGAWNEDPQALTDKIKLVRDKFEDNTMPKEPDGQVLRVGRRFSLVAAAGELAIGWSILPGQKGDALWAAQNCFDDWLATRGGAGSGEETTILEQVKDFLSSKQFNSFYDLESGVQKSPVRDLAGYLKTFTHFTYGPNVGRSVFAVLPGVFKKEICRGYAPEQVCEVLKKRGYLLTDKDNKPNIQVKINHKNQRLYCINQSILGDCLGDEIEEEVTEDGADF